MYSSLQKPHQSTKNKKLFTTQTRWDHKYMLSFEFPSVDKKTILLARSQNSLSKKHWSDIIKEHPNTKLHLKFDVDKTWMDSKDYEKCHYLLHILDLHLDNLIKIACQYTQNDGGQ